MTPAEFKALRQRLGLSQARLAELLGLSAKNGERTVRRYEHGEGEIPGPIERLLRAAARWPAVLAWLQKLGLRD